MESIEEFAGFDKKVLKQAIKALKGYVEKKEGQHDLLTTLGTALILNFQLNKIPPKVQPRQVGIQLPFPIYLNNEISLCIIIKDKPPQLKDEIRTQWKSADFHGMELPKIIRLSKLKRNYATMSSRRELAKMFDLFFCDEHIIDQMPKYLGKVFIVAKKLPIPIKISCQNPIRSIKERVLQTFLRGSQSWLYNANKQRDFPELYMKIVRLMFPIFSVLQSVASHVNASMPDHRIHYVHLSGTDLPALRIFIHSSLKKAVKVACAEAADKDISKSMASKKKKRKFSALQESQPNKLFRSR